MGCCKGPSPALSIVVIAKIGLRRRFRRGGKNQVLCIGAKTDWPLKTVMLDNYVRRCGIIRGMRTISELPETGMVHHTGKNLLRIWSWANAAGMKGWRGCAAGRSLLSPAGLYPAETRKDPLYMAFAA